MAKLNKVPDHIKAQVEALNTVSGASAEETRRLELWEDVNSLFTSKDGTTDILRSIGMMTRLDKGFAEEFAYEAENAGFKSISENIEKFASGDGFTRAAQPVSSTTFGGDADLAETYVEKSIFKRLEDEVPVLPYVYKKTGKISGDRKTRNAKFPIWSDTFAPTPKSATATLDDFTDDTTGGIKGLDNKLVEAYKIGLTMDFEAESYVKLDQAYMAELLTIARGVYARGLKANLYTGNGSAPNATGMFTNATAITYTSDIITTLRLMLASVGDASRTSKGYFGITNTAGAAFIAAQVANNESFNLNIDQTNGVAGRVMGVPIIVDNSFQASGTSPNKTSPFYLGATGNYFYVDGGTPKVESNPYANFKSGMETTRVMGFVGGTPAYNNSFAKTDLPNVY